MHTNTPFPWGVHAFPLLHAATNSDYYTTGSMHACIKAPQAEVALYDKAEEENGAKGVKAHRWTPR